jgi:hypothetical protein
MIRHACRLPTAQRVLIGLIAIGVSCQAMARTSKLDAELPGSLSIDAAQNMNPCAAGMIFDQVSRAAGVPLVFENLRGCYPGPRSALRPSVQSGQTKSARQLLNELTTLVPQFAWREMNGIVVVRPRDAWESSADPLNQAIGSLDFRESSLENVVEAIVNSTTSLRVLPQSRLIPPPAWSTRPLTMRFQGGTVLEALITLASTQGDLTWQLGYSGQTGGILAIDSLESLGAGIVVPIALPNKSL